MIISEIITITKNTVIQENITFQGEGKIIVKDGVTLTINGLIYASENQQIFEPESANSRILGINNPYVYASWFGAIPNTGKNMTTAMQNVANYINHNNGGHVVFAQGVYLVGRQNEGTRNAYQSESILLIENTQNPVIVEGGGAIFRRVDGLKYGAFDLNTGQKCNIDGIPCEGYEQVIDGEPVSGQPRELFKDYTFQASLAYGILDFRENQDVTVRNLEIDGNAYGTNIGGYFSHGYQLCGGHGIAFTQNERVTTESIYTHNNLADGYYIAYLGQGFDGVDKPHNMSQVISHYNGRHGLSWTGGNGLNVIDSEFSFSGQGAITSPTGAGLDIEAQQTIIRRGSFTNTKFVANKGAGIVANNTNSADIIFDNVTAIGTDYFSLLIWKYPENQGDKEGYQIKNSRFYGTFNINSLDYPENENGLKISNTRFYDYHPDYENLFLRNNYLINAGNIQGVEFFNSTAFLQKGTNLGWMDGDNLSWQNIKIITDNDLIIGEPQNHSRNNYSTGELSYDQFSYYSLTGNNVKSILVQPMIIENDTLLNFEFRADNPTDLQGIGFDNNSKLSSRKVANLYGLREDWGFQTYRYKGKQEWQDFSINLGYFTGENLDRITLFNFGENNNTSQIEFKNIFISNSSF